MKHALEVAGAFGKVYIGPVKAKTSTKDVTGGSTGKAGKWKNENNSSFPSRSTRNVTQKGVKQLPLCLIDKCKKEGRRHYIKDCTFLTKEGQKSALDAHRPERAKSGPANNSRSLAKSKTEPCGTSTNASGKTAALLALRKVLPTAESSSSCTMTISDEELCHKIRGRCDDGNDETILSPRIADNCMFTGIGKMKAVRPVHLQVALKQGDESESFPSSR